MICGLILAVIAAYATVAYQQMKSAALSTASGQLTAVSAQLAGMIAMSAARARAEVDSLAATPSVRSYLAAPDSAAGEALRAALQPEGADDAIIGTELRDGTGRRVLTTAASVPGEPTALDPDLRGMTQPPATGGAGPIRTIGETLVFPVVSPVEAQGRRLGTLIRWQRLAGSEIVSSGAGVYLANDRGDLWTDLNRRVDPVAIDPELLRGESIAGPLEVGGALVVAAPVEGAPWTIVVQFPVDLVMGAPRRLIGRMILFGLGLMLAAALAAWILTGRFTRSIAELASAARAISGGDYNRRTPVSGTDEIGVLGTAFNTMAVSVAEAHRQLEEKVAELESSEQQHRETRERMEHVISSSRVILYKYTFADREVHLDWVSDNVKRMLGYDPEEALRPGAWRRLLHPDDHDRFRTGRDRLEAQGTATLEYRLRHADGEYRWMRDEQRLLRDENGRPREVVGVLSDLSEQHRLAGEKAAAEAASLAKSDFLSRMSHELRTPLNSVLGFGQLLELDVESEENRESVTQILKAGKHLLSLIDEVLDIARIESGQMSLSVEPVWVAGTIKEGLDLVRLTAAEEGIELRAQEALACDHYVWADQQRLKQVVLNLLSNAIKYNRRQGTVTVRCELVEGGNRIRVVVEDTGFGIPAGRMKLLFTPFERLGAEQAGVEGTGLGLALSRGLMEAMGGSLSASSEEGGGSRFWIELPISEKPVIADPAAEETAPPLAEEVSQTTHTVLFIEDNLANVRLLERLFQRRPWLRLLTAMQGSLGIQLARERRPDLILLDLNLPDVPGDVVLRNIRQDPDLREIPVVMISGDAIPSQVQRLLDLGARAYITKPFDLQELLRVVDEMVDGNG
ncbi:MAG TPA: ATP-binding protein [Longimicrobiaceae bacterium]